MSAIVQRWQSNHEADIIWRFCLFIAWCILLITIWIFILSIQHLFCIRKSTSFPDINSKTRQRQMRTYSTLAITFATLSIVVSFSKYLVCTAWSCAWQTQLSWMYIFLWWDFYVLAKLFLYFIFVCRLFHPLYRRICSYSRHIQYFLWMLLLVLVLSATVSNIDYGLYMLGREPPRALDSVCTAVYAITDCTLSIIMMILFFRPLCRGNEMNSNNADVSVLQKYGILSSLQLFAALSFQISFVGESFVYMIVSTMVEVQEYNHIINIIQMIDCLLLMFCIYFGFARKYTVRILTLKH